MPSICSEKLDSSFFNYIKITKKLKKNFVGTDKENTRAILELLEDFIFSDKRSGSYQTVNLGLKLYTVFFIAETV